MKSNQKEGLAYGLMIGSILLLCGFQLFWLHKSWTEQYSLLQKEASHLFTRSIVDVQDSILQNWLETQVPNQTDSVQVSVLHYQEGIIEHRRLENGTTRIITRGESVKGEKKIRLGGAQVRLEADSSEPEWMPGLLQSIIVKVQSRDSTGLLPFEQVDSSQFLSCIAATFKDSLEVNFTPLPFSIISKENEDGMEGLQGNC